MPTSDTLITEIALGIDSALMDWETGKSTSPDQRDYVLIAIDTFKRHYPDFVVPQDDGIESVADAIFEDAGETYVTTRDIATFIYEQLSLGVPA